MSTRQYIPPFYINKIYENSLDATSTDWESDTEYPVNILVSYSSKFYISRKPVPDTVGNPEDNKDYWAATTF